MKRSIIVLAALALFASLAAGEQSVYLLDGSVLQGSVISMDGRRVLLATAYADSLSLPRDQVLALLLKPELGNPLPLHPTSAPPVKTEVLADASPGHPAVEGRGILELAIKGDAVKSSARFRDNEDRDRVMEMAKLYLRIYLDGKEIYEEVDASIEKEFRERQHVYLRNQHRFQPISLELPAGTYTAHVVVGNKMDALQEGENQSKLVSAEIAIEDLRINPDEVTRVVLQGKGSRWGYGKYGLEILSQR